MFPSTHRISTAAGLLVAALGLGQLSAAVITFDGGSLNGSSPIPNDYGTTFFSPGGLGYIEDGMKVTVLPGSEAYVGDYYGSSNNVLHWHGVGPTNQVRFELVSGSTFDLNSLLLTSNTISGGGAANGTELAYVVGSNGQSFKLPSNGWGPSYADFLVQFDSSLFDNISWFTIGATSNVYCMGVDNVSFDVSAIPEPGSCLTLALVLSGGLFGFRNRGRRA